MSEASPYLLAAQGVFLLVAVATAAAGIFSGAWLGEELRAFARRRWARAAGVALAFQAGTSVLAIIAASAGWASGQLAAVVSANWLMVLLATAALPWAVRQDDQDAPAEGRKAFPVGAALALATGLVVGSFAWFGLAGLVVDVKEHEALRSLPRDPLFWLVFPGLALVAGAAEEVLFRGGMQPALRRLMGARKGARVAAIVLPAAVFALGHAAYSEPPLLKEAQILAVGCALGWARDRWGLAAAAAIHMAFNLAVVLVSLAAQWGPGV